MKHGFFSGLLAGSLLAATVATAGDYPYRPANMTDVSIKEGFWLPRFETNRKVTVWADFRKSEETGRIANFMNAAKRLKGSFKGIPFDDSDVFKIIEGAAYTLATHPDAELEKYLDELIDIIAAAQEPDGYLYTARTTGFDYGTQNGKTNYGMMGPTRWSNCPSSHELYNVGHMYEAAVAYYNVTGKRKLLDVAIRSADLVERTFGPGPTQLKAVPGHEEIELALCKLYRTTGDVRYLNLARHFLKQRGDGTKVGAGQQAHIPVVEQREAVGHAVRATYLYCGMADVAALAGDQAFIDAVDAIWANVAEKKLHLTGGVGARRGGEAFGDNYELPNERAYLETCAAIGNALWNQRMFLMHGDAKYIDILERIIYNGFLSGISLTGDEFFYPNPLASKGGYARSKWFGCSCCPVNVVRFIPQIAQFAYALRENTAYVNLFVASDAKLKLDNGEIKLAQQTEYPWKGLSMITVTPATNGQQFDLAIHIPGWAIGRPVPSDLYTQVVPAKLDDVTVLVNGQKVAFTPEKGYCRISRAWQAGDAVEIRMAMPVRRIKANDNVKDDIGRLAVERGPIVYCAEGVDNDGDVLNKIIKPDAVFKDDTVSVLDYTFPALTTDAVTLTRNFKGDVTSKTPCTLKLIPYFAWCHRGAGQMQTWFPAEEKGEYAVSPIKATASHCHIYDRVEAVCDGVIAKSSGDEGLPRLTYWPHKGTTEWVELAIPAAENFTGIEVYWFDDEPRGGCRIPASWRVLYKGDNDTEWQPINCEYPIALDKFCTAKFPKPVKAKIFHIEIKLKEGFSTGMTEIRPICE